MEGFVDPAFASAFASNDTMSNSLPPPCTTLSHSPLTILSLSLTKSKIPTAHNTLHAACLLKFTFASSSTLK